MASTLRAIQADIARETGSPCHIVVAERALDMALWAHGELIAGQGWCDGGYCCRGTNLEVRDAEHRTIAAEATQYREEGAAQLAQAKECAAAMCGHYTCTEAGALGYWAGNDRRLPGNF